MLKCSIIAVLLGVSFCFSTNAQEVQDSIQHQVVPEFNKATFERIRSQIDSGQTDVDYLALRWSFANTKWHDPYERDSQKKIAGQLWQALADSNFAKAAKAGNKLIEKEFVSLEGHLGLHEAYEGLRDSTRAAYHFAIWQGLLTSIGWIGDGLTDSTAYVAIFIHEEYSYARFRGFTEIKLQAVNEVNGNYFDIITARNPGTGEERDFWFSINATWRHNPSR